MAKQKEDLRFFCLGVFSVLLISCSDEGSSGSSGSSGNTGNAGATQVTGNVAGSAGNAGATQVTGNAEGGMANPASTGSAPSSSPKHWILSQPFQRIEAGSFTMGSPGSERGRNLDEKQVQVTISKPFEIMTTEVTQSMWVRVMSENPSFFQLQKYCDDHEQKMCPNHPVEQVSWVDVREFIRKLNKALGLTGCDGTPSSAKNCYRLPTEAEWEYATRAGTTTAYSYGDDPDNLGDYAWYRDNSDRQTHAVGSKSPNPWGLYDVHGNVGELVYNSYTRNLLGGPDPSDDSGRIIVYRGGSWSSYTWSLRSADRDGIGDYKLDYDVGFRLVRTL